MKSTVEASHGPNSKYGDGMSRRKSSVPALWGSQVADSKLKTSVQSGGQTTTGSRGSSDNSLLSPDDNIYVTTDVDMRSIPMARLRMDSEC